MYQKKFIILSTQRTGSAFLEQCINSHEDIVCHGEILLGYGGHYTDLPPKWLKSHRRLRTLWQAIASGAFLYPKKTMEMTWNTKSPQEWRGFRLMYNQINRNPRVMHYLNNHTEIKVIHLQRRNLLKQYISLYLMHNQSRYGRYEAHVTKKPSQIKVRVDQNKALNYFRSVEKTRNNILLKFKEFERLDVEVVSFELPCFFLDSSTSRSKIKLEIDAEVRLACAKLSSQSAIRSADPKMTKGCCLMLSGR